MPLGRDLYQKTTLELFDTPDLKSLESERLMLKIKQVLIETNYQLEPIENLEMGFKVYNKPHEKEEVINITTDREEIYEGIQNKWFISHGINKWILKAPETSICDLSEIHKNPSYGQKDVLTLYRLLKKLNIQKLLDEIKNIHDLKSLELTEIRGKSLETEFRIAGSDSRVEKIPGLIYDFLKDTEEWEEEMNYTESILTERDYLFEEKSFDELQELTKDFYKRISEKYVCPNGLFGEKITKPNRVFTKIWKKIPSSDVYIFVPLAGIKYALGYVEGSQKPESVMLWEYHASMVLNKELIIFRKDLKDKNVAIIDRSYSGNTIKYISEQVRKLDGKPLRVALFPKSSMAFQNTDYFMFVDKIIPSNNVYGGNNWCEELFVDVINNE